MLENFVTLFDSKYLAQGLVLYESLTTKGNASIWVICMDDKTYNILNSFNFPNLKPIHYKTCETPELLAVKSSRTTGEYCWTFTPFTFTAIYSLDPSLNRLTYVDADLYFLKNFNEIFDEFERSKKNILITKHNYSGFLNSRIKEKKFGKFCVQFITVNNNKSSMNVINWWQKKNIDWCFARVEKGKFGDQKYLDEWPKIFKNDVYILKNKDFALAPWNVNSFSDSLLLRKTIFYHFHGFRILNNSKFVLFNGYKIESTTKNLYQIYINEIVKNLQLIDKSNFKIYYPPISDNFLTRIKKAFLNFIGLRKEVKIHINQSACENKFD